MGWDLSGESGDVLPSNPSAEQWLTAFYGRRHLNCLIMDPGYDSLSHPERNRRWVVWAEVQLLYHLALQCVCTVCVCVCIATECEHVFAAPVKVAHRSNISWVLCSYCRYHCETFKASICFNPSACPMAEWEFSVWDLLPPNTFSTLELEGELHLTIYVTFQNRQSCSLHAAIIVCAEARK